MGDVARAQRTRSTIQNHTENLVKVANVKAKKAYKRDEGLTVDEGIHHLNLTEGVAIGRRVETKEEDDDDVRPYKQHGKSGYEVKEYDTKEYDTGEYETSEYKSVYD